MVARWEEGPFVPGPYADREVAALGDAYAEAMLAIDERRARTTSEFATLIAEQAYGRSLAEAERDRLARLLRRIRAAADEGLPAEAASQPAAGAPQASHRPAWAANDR